MFPIILARTVAGFVDESGVQYHALGEEIGEGFIKGFVRTQRAVRLLPFKGRIEVGMGIPQLLSFSFTPNASGSPGALFFRR
jgi:hypothetical protein